jgi:peptidoglycan hydrolase-like amidase
MTRNLTLVIEGYAKTATNLDDTLDTIASEVEAAMAGDRTVTGWAVTSHLTGTEISLTGDGDQPVGVVSMSYLVTYRTSDLDPDTSLQ